ncbi:hypothetical protein [Parabacteroides sp.]
MRLIRLCILLLTLYPLAVHSQDKAQWRGGEKAPLPAFFFERLGEDEAWGISDPLLESDQALEQAVKRALFLLSMQEPHPYQKISEWYMHTQTDSNTYDYKDEKINILLRVNADTTHYSYEILEQERSLFGEIFVKIRRTSNGLRQDLYAFFESFFCTVAQPYANHDKRIKLRIGYTPPAQEQWKEFDYQYQGDNYNPTILSTFQESTQTITQKGYWYKEYETSPEYPGKNYPLKNACWGAVIESLADALSTVETSEVKKKTLSEGYDRLTQAMTTELITGNIRVLPIILGVQDNQLQIQWKTEMSTIK